MEMAEAWGRYRNFSVCVNGAEVFRFAADLVEGSASLLIERDGGELDPTPFQTASAEHDYEKAGKMLCAWLNLAHEGDEIEVKEDEDEDSENDEDEDHDVEDAEEEDEEEED
jgi:hypothetical protein